GFVRQLPLTGSGPMQPYAWDEESARRWESVSADWRSASPGYFRALRIRLLAGRMFEAGDDVHHPGVVIVDSLFAARVFPGQQGGGTPTPREHGGQLNGPEPVGVTPPPPPHAPARDVGEQIYQPQSQVPVFKLSVVVRGSDSTALLRPIEQTLHA